MKKLELSFKVADVLAIGFELVIEETKKLKKISNRFEAEFKILQELKNTLELKQEIEVNPTTFTASLKSLYNKSTPIFKFFFNKKLTTFSTTIFYNNTRNCL